MSLQFTNTLTGRKEEFKPLKEGQVSLYVCGVTVYDHCHIGHARGVVVFDVLRRFLTSRGFQVTYVRNITDVDDKIIERARQWGQTPEGLTPPGFQDLNAKVRSVAERYTESFQKDFARLGLLPPDQEPKATAYVLQMQAFIQKLIERDMAYAAADGVYFSVRKFPEYGALSHQKPDQMLEGVRIESGEGKRDPLDFALWKKAKTDEPIWDSPWGPGRPGWHIECSTMSTVLLGDEFDIHGGGQDLIFPHHENERAQALGVDKRFARYWLHNGLLTVNGQKMSKSLGNFVTIEDALDRHPADVLRLFFLSAHYRSPMDFTWERLDEAARAYKRLFAFFTRVEQTGQGIGKESQEVQESRVKFMAAMEDDLNTPEALGALYQMITKAIPWFSGHYEDEEAIQAGVAAGGSTPQEAIRNMDRLLGAANALKELGGILGLSFSQNIPAEIQILVQERNKAREEKDYIRSDQIRKQLMELGYIVEDTTDETVVRKRV